ncbi:hypothetical protein BDZ97DRAFT_2061939 [Flammula alnicola]|nr:hypothetical protein BDZ97DRAFT_2061939 [Flammula alnicola]
MTEQSVLDENPLSLELKSLRASVARFQEEAHASAVKLQRHSLDSVRVHERAVHFERENDLLKAEIAVLRANPHPDASPTTSDTQTQIQELTLSLRRLSHKLSSTEDELLAKTTELVHAHAETLKAKASADNAYELGARVRGREEAGKVREQDSERKIRQLEEDMKMADVVINEYADLVREMEAKLSATFSSESSHANGSAHTSADLEPGDVTSAPKFFATTLLESKLSRERLLAQFQDDSEKLEAELHRVSAEREVATSQLEAEKKGNEAIENELGLTKTELEKLHLEDGTAAKMVSRYMQFSQTSTNNLLSTLSTLKARHAGTLSTLSSQNYLLSARLRSVEVQNERLRSALDELGGEIMKETYGRRREVGLRIKMGGREERLVEGLRRWIRRGEEMLARLREAENADDHSRTREFEALLTLAQDARILLESLDEGVLDEETVLSLSGGKARAFLVKSGMDGLLDELRVETERRLNLVKKLASVRLDTLSENGMVPVPTGGNMIGGVTDSPTLKSDWESDANEVNDEPPQVPEKTPIHSPQRLSPLTPLTLPQLPPHSDIQETEHPAEAISENVSAKAQPDGERNYMKDNNTPNRVHIPQRQEQNPIDTTALDDHNELPPPNVFQHPLTSSSNREINLDTQDFESSDNRGAMRLTSNADTILDIDFQDSQKPLPIPSEESLDKSTAPSISTTPPDASEQENRPSEKVTNSEEIAVSSSPSPAVASEDASNHTSDPPSSHNTPLPPLPPPSPSSGPTNSVAFPQTPPSNFTSIPPRNIPQENQKPAGPHPLLADLARVNKRYDDLQRAFRDCHLALEGLKASLRDTSSSSSSSLPMPVPMPIPPDILSAALGRLDDYTEDARVELEIRVGDEALLARGYEALLSVPGALAASTPSSSSIVVDGEPSHEDHGVPTQSEVERQVAEFVGGQDPAVRKARDTFSRKLEDVQHDIAALKRAIHDPESLAQPPPGSLPAPPLSPLGSTTPSSSTSSLVSPSKPDTANNGGGGGGWTSWIRSSSSRPSSPAPTGPAPTFGNIMTSPRLRHSPSSGNMQPNQRSRRPSFFGLGGGGPSEPVKDPFATLELRVPMPSFGVSHASGGGGGGGGGVFGGGYGVLSPTSPMKPMMQSLATTPTRARTVSSTMYMLGLGAVGTRTVSASGSGSALSSNGSASPLGMSRQSSQSSSRSSQGEARDRQGDVEEETEDETEDEEDTDVE